MMPTEEGFYLARRKDDGTLTVIELRLSHRTLWIMPIGTDYVPDPDEALATFDFIGRIQEPEETPKR